MAGSDDHPAACLLTLSRAVIAEAQALPPKKQPIVKITIKLRRKRHKSRKNGNCLNVVGNNISSDWLDGKMAVRLNLPSLPVKK
jgi:hypothetical protein